MSEFMAYEYWNDLFGIIVKGVQIVGIPITIFLYYKNKRKEHKAQEYATYNALDDKYIAYLQLCANNADLDVAEPPRIGLAPLTSDQKFKEQVILTVLISIMERAFLMYKDKKCQIRINQWQGWANFIQDWCKRTNFTDTLDKVGRQFDTEFVKFLDIEIVKEKQKNKEIIKCEYL